MKLIVNGVDISQFYENITWSGSKGQAARKLEFGVVVSGTDPNLPKLSIMMENKVQLINDDGTTIFSGLVKSKEKSIDGNLMQVICYDALIDFNKSQGSFSFVDKTPNEIATEVFKKGGLSTGTLESGDKITRIFDNESLYNIVLIAYKLESEKNKKQFIIQMKDDKAEVVEKGKIVAKYTLDGETNLINANYSETSENSVTSVQIFDENGKKVGEVKGNEGGNVTQIYRQEKNEDSKARAEALLKGIEKEATVSAIGDFDLITGNAVIIKEPFTGLNGKFYIDEDTHHFQNGMHTVDLNLAYENIMADISTEVQDNNTENADGNINFTASGTPGKALQAGASVQGARYLWGGNNPSTGIDCSGFVMWSYQQAGVKFNGRITSSAMRSNPKQFGFVEVPFSQRQPGDVLWSSGHLGMQYDSTRIIESGGTSKSKLGYSGVAIGNGSGRSFSKAYRYVGG